MSWKSELEELMFDVKLPMCLGRELSVQKKVKESPKTPVGGTMELIIQVSTTPQEHAHHQMMELALGQQTMTWTKR